MLPAILAEMRELREALARVESLAAMAARRRGRDVDLDGVLAGAWQAFAEATWCVSDLRRAQIIGENEGIAVGQALRELLDAGGRWGRFELGQVHGVATRDGRVWTLRRLR
jgi:hypothetical protein